MSLSLVETAIRTRLTGDSTLLGYLPSSSAAYITTNMGPAAPNYPYVVIETSDEEDHDAFQSDGYTASVQIHVYALVESGQVTARSIIERVRGEATRAPSYGLHRLNLNLADGSWNGSVMLRTGGSTQHDRDTLHYIESYRVKVSRPVSG